MPEISGGRSRRKRMRIPHLYSALRYKSAVMRPEIISDPKVRQTLAAASRASGRAVASALQNKRYFVDMAESYAVTLGAQVAVGRYFAERNGEPELIVGHSLGHYAGLVMAGSLDFEETLSHLSASGRAADDYFHRFNYATMLFGGVAGRAVFNKAAEIGGILLQMHSDGSVAIGRTDPLNEFKAFIEQMGGETKAVPLRLPFHNDLMKPAFAVARAGIDKLSIHSPRITFLSTYNVEHLSSPEAVFQALANEMVSPHKLQATIQKLVDAGHDSVIEMTTAGFDEVALAE